MLWTMKTPAIFKFNFPRWSLWLPKDVMGYHNRESFHHMKIGKSFKGRIQKSELYGLVEPSTKT